LSIETKLTEDPNLPALTHALNPGFIGPLLSRVQGNRPQEAPPVAWSLEVLNHKLGRRCTIRYSPLGRDYDEPPMRPVVGKLYSDKVKAQPVYDRTSTLRTVLSGEWVGGGIPAPLGVIPEMGMVIQEHVDGVDLRQLFHAKDWRLPLSQAAQWLALMHTMPIIGGLKTKSVEHELGRAEGWCGEILPYISATTQERLIRTVELLHQIARRMGGYTETMIHRDFYDAQIIWDGRRVWILDFDQLCVGDPALDVGHCVAHLASLAYRVTGRPDSLAVAARILLETYLKSNPISIESRLPFYKACTFIKLAAKEARRKREHWQRAVSVLTDLACDELERAV